MWRIALSRQRSSLLLVLLMFLTISMFENCVPGQMNGVRQDQEDTENPGVSGGIVGGNGEGYELRSQCRSNTISLFKSVVHSLCSQEQTSVTSTTRAVFPPHPALGDDLTRGRRLRPKICQGGSTSTTRGAEESEDSPGAPDASILVCKGFAGLWKWEIYFVPLDETSGDIVIYDGICDACTGNKCQFSLNPIVLPTNYSSNEDEILFVGTSIRGVMSNESNAGEFEFQYNGGEIDVATECQPLNLGH